MALADPGGSHGLALRMKKVALLTAATIVAINIWTGGPLLALWVGSRIQGDSGLGMGTLFVVVGMIALVVFVLATALAWLNSRYDALVGRKPQRQQYPWLRSMRAEREQEARRARGVSGVEKVVIASVVVAVLAFEIWFFFFAKYSFPAA